MSHGDLFVCYYGTKNAELVNHINISWQDNFDLPILHYCVDTSTPDLYFNLWKASVTKMDIELTTKKFFHTVIAINLDDEQFIQDFTEKTRSHLFIRPKQLFEVNNDTVYYCIGSLIALYKTAINPSIFYANSSTFSIVANYGLVRKSIERETNMALSSGPLEKIKNELTNDHIYFYNFLKSHKLKTECVNYENRGMFKRST